MPQQELGIPPTIVRAVQIFVTALAPHLSEGDLRFGGGTALQARWQHRRSTDADLFCDPQTYATAIRARGEAMERALRDVSATTAGEGTFVDQIATYTRIECVEVTILPAATLVHPSGSGKFVPGTAVETLTSAEILAGKLVHRLTGAGIAEPRDIYDLAMAREHDPVALRQAVAALTANQRKEVAVMIELLPSNWADSSRERPLLDADPNRADLTGLAGLLRHQGTMPP
ncbi:MAG: nucleotidyl transferase AbiEii/AbiGii toxin family protein [Gammaproteobacteria bacterium]|nr:nucleotidyl transferase AbiEii/AbiGii toxin family protein [Gammaproteobacteria bacterium]